MFQVSLTFPEDVGAFYLGEVLEACLSEFAGLLESSRNPNMIFFFSSKFDQLRVDQSVFDVLVTEGFMMYRISLV